MTDFAALDACPGPYSMVRETTFTEDSLFSSEHVCTTIMLECVSCKARWLTFSSKNSVRTLSIWEPQPGLHRKRTDFPSLPGFKAY